MKANIALFSPPISIPLAYDHTYKAIFVDILLARGSAVTWLRMTEPALGAELARLYEWVLSDDHSDRYAIEWICGAVSRPPTVQAIRTALKALVPVPDSYWAACARIRANVEREEPFDPIAAALDEIPDGDEHW
jgi:hypothetical protein